MSSASPNTGQSTRDRLVYEHIWSTEPDRRPSDTARLMVSLLAEAAVRDGRPLDQVRFADLASGSGRHALWASEAGLDVTSVEYDEVGVRRQRDGLGLDHVVHADVRDWVASQAGVTWDGIVIFDAVHHMHAEPAAAAGLMTDIRELLAPGGLLLVTLLCDISYSRGIVPTDRLAVTADEGEELLRGVLRDDELLVFKRKPVHVQSTLTADEMGNIVESSYDSVRVMALARLGA